MKCHSTTAEGFHCKHRISVAILPTLSNKAPDEKLRSNAFAAEECVQKFPDIIN